MNLSPVRPPSRGLTLRFRAVHLLHAPAVYCDDVSGSGVAARVGMVHCAKFALGRQRDGDNTKDGLDVQAHSTHADAKHLGTGASANSGGRR